MKRSPSEYWNFCLSFCEILGFKKYIFITGNIFYRQKYSYSTITNANMFSSHNCKSIDLIYIFITEQ